MNSKREFVIYAGGICVFAALVLILAHHLQYRHQELERRREILEQYFGNSIAMAKQSTGDPCTAQFYENIPPPVGIMEDPRLIIMGEEVPYMAADPSAFRLVPKGDHVELWADFRSSFGIRGKRKLGEKYDPDSPFCKAKQRP